MNSRRFQIMVVASAAIYASLISGKAQAFANLNFEASLGNPVYGGIHTGYYYVLPDWNVNAVGYVGAAPGVYDGDPGELDATYGFIVPAGGTPGAFGGTLYPLDGDQSLALYASAVGTAVSLSISQTGTIPQGQNSVSFLLGYFNGLNLPSSPNPLNYFSLSINNQNVPLVETSENGQVLTVAGNISEWAGQSVTLSIAANTVSGNAESFGVIDDVAFSPQVVAVPEPSVMGLLAAALSLSVVLVNKNKLS